MPSNRLRGKTIVITGSNKTMPVKQFIQENGGTCAVFPLIDITERQSADDADMLAQLNAYDWLIFTSQNAVQAFIEKCQRNGINVQKLPCKVASVGAKTTALLHKHGLSVHFEPSVFSADVFIQEFPVVSENAQRKLFVRGSLAKPTIRDSIPNVVEWTVYETIANVKAVQPLTELVMQRQQQVIIIFASPSAVAVFNQYIAPIVGWANIRAAAIGHITAAALRHFGVDVYVQPATYTMQAVVEEIILLEESS